MAIYVNVQYNGGLLPDVILLTQRYFPFKCQEEVLYLQPLIPPKRFGIPPPLTGGCSEGLGAFWFFLRHHKSIVVSLLNSTDS